jgi:zinc protease
LGNMFNYNGPMLWMANFTYDNKSSTDSILIELDTILETLKNQVNQQDLDLALIKLRSGLYDTFGSNFGRADLLASFALFDNNPNRINTIESDFKKVTPETIKKTLAEFMRPENRTVLIIDPLNK